MSTLSASAQESAEILFERSRQQWFVRTDHMFAALMTFQWIGGIIAAAILSPRNWAGGSSSIHPHLYAAVFLGAAISFPPICLALWRPGQVSTRMVIAIGQMLTSALLIHISGGRIETHFHVFGSLAFLALYRDWRVLIPATIVVAADHILRGLYFPESVYGVAVVSPWRWLEHASWVLFEDFILVIACRRSEQDMHDTALNTAALNEKQRQLRQTLDARDAAEAASHSKTDFLANMSHEIRTPMTAILGYADLLLEPDSSASDRLDSLQVIRRNARHLLQLINDILDLSKIEAGKLKIERLPCDLPQTISSVVSMIRPRAMEKQLDLRVVFDGPIPKTVQSDPLRIKQILMNLLGNAIKFTQRGMVTLRVGCESDSQGARVVFDVADTGIGMTPEQLQMIFQPFTQADESTTRRFGGTGLGLVICKRLCEMLDGEVTVNSTYQVGSTFHVRIDPGPLEGVEMLSGLTEASLQSTEELLEPMTRGSVVCGRVLLAEDGPDNQVLISIFLRQAGAQIVLADNGKTAVTLARSEHFDLILMDMQMPELDGYGAASELRARGIKTPIMALTAHAMTGDREKCLRAGCTDYLSKPVDRDLLVEKLQQYMSPINRSAPAPAAPPPVQNAPMTMESAIVAFVAKLPDRAARLSLLLEERNLNELKRMAHQLKGSGGGYGFPQLTESAGIAEQAAAAAIANGSNDAEAALQRVVSTVNDLLATIRSVKGYPNSHVQEVACRSKC